MQFGLAAGNYIQSFDRKLVADIGHHNIAVLWRYQQRTLFNRFFQGFARAECWFFGGWNRQRLAGLWVAALTFGTF